MPLRSPLCLVLALALPLPAQAEEVRGRDAPDAAAAPSVQQELEALRGAARAGDAAAFWDWLPASYRRDVEQLVHALAGRVDPELWTHGMALAARIAELGRRHEAFVFANPLVAEAFHGAGEERAARAMFGALVEVLGAVAASDLRSVEALRRFDGRTFAAKTGPALLRATLGALRAQGEDPVELLSSMSFRTRREQADEATVEVRLAGGAPTLESMLRIEGRWVPKAFAHEWPRVVERARRALAALPAAADVRERARARLTLATIEGFVRRFEDVQTQAEFDGVCAELLARSGDAHPALPVRR